VGLTLAFALASGLQVVYTCALYRAIVYHGVRGRVLDVPGSLLEESGHVSLLLADAVFICLEVNFNGAVVSHPDLNFVRLRLNHV
jgi:hypothetical protein